MKEVKTLFLGGKETNRTFDYQCVLIISWYNICTIILHPTILHVICAIILLVQQLLQTMVEIQRIAYSSENDRTPNYVLRLHNMSWYHGIVSKEVFGCKAPVTLYRIAYVSDYFSYRIGVSFTLPRSVPVQHVGAKSLRSGGDTKSNPICATP